VAEKKLTVHNASVTTMSVEVKTLTIGARQVTQGIFKQLIEEPLIAEDGTLNGVPWGRVTWHPDKCDGSREHWHIVWQRGSELRRARVAEVPDFDANLRTGGIQTRFWCLEADLSLASTVREWLHGRHESPLTPKPGHTAIYQDTYSSPTEHGFSVYAIPSDQAVAAVKAKLAVAEATKFHEAASAHGGDLTYAETRVSNADVALAEAIRQLEAEIGQASYEETTEALNAATQAEAERRQRHRDIHAALAELPQLFIGG
jgi:hypothetical protein